MSELNQADRLPFGNYRSIIHSSGNAFVDSLRQFKRPFVDAAFTRCKDQYANSTALQIGEMTLTAISTSPAHFKTDLDPQFTIILPFKGWNKLKEKNRVTIYGQRKEVVSVSYSERIEIDCHSMTIGIHPKVAGLFNETQQQQPEFNKVVERLTTSGATLYSSKSHKHDYYQMLLNLIKLVDTCGGDGAYLRNIGLDGLINNVIARAILEHGCYGHDLKRALRKLEGVRAVDLICNSIQQNIGSPLTVAGMTSLTGLSGGELNLAFQSRFECSPIEWQRNFLLDLARSYLKSDREPVSVQVIARELGFISPRSFLQHYRKRFGTDWITGAAAENDALGTPLN